MRTLRARADKIHFTTQNIPELRYFINPSLTNNAAHSGDPLVSLVGPYWSGLLSIKLHRAKLGQNEGMAVCANAFLSVKNGSPRIDLNQNRRENHEGQRKNGADKRD